jgi:protein involved in polysaccharide export with SLBB domain
MNRFFLSAAFLLLCTSFPVAAEDAPEAAPAPLQKGDAILVRIENMGGGLPEYREIVDSDGNIEMPFLGFLSAEGKFPADIESEMATAYAKAKLATNASVQVTFVTHFDPPPARQTLIRSEDPRRPIPAPAPAPMPPAAN